MCTTVTELNGCSVWCLSVHMLPTVLGLAYVIGKVTGPNINEIHDLVSPVVSFLFISINTYYLHAYRNGKEGKPTKAPILIWIVEEFFVKAILTPFASVCTP